MNGKVCIITGSNAGIGKATALGLANKGATVVMVCRNRRRGEIAKAEIIKKAIISQSICYELISHHSYR